MKQTEIDPSTSNTSSNHFLNNFFYPEKVAIVGATKNPMKMNFHLMNNNDRLNFKGKLIPINPNADEILGEKTYPSLKEVPKNEKIDVVVISLPSNKCVDIIKDCIELKIKHIVIVAGGFSDGGDEGERRHEEIKKLIKAHNLHVMGPNTLSPINIDNNLVISFHAIKELRRGDVSFVFQSGLYEYKLNWLFSHIGINKVLDLGNKIDINEVNALEYLGNDPGTKVIAMHIESIQGDGKKFIENLKETTAKKPVIIMKSGRTSSGSMAAASHTGSMAKENDAILDGLIKQCGAIRASNLEDFFDLAKTFSFLKSINGNKVAIVTLSGGEGVIAADACETYGLEMAKMNQDSFNRLKQIFPPWDMPVNPFDAGVCFQFHANDFENAFNTLEAIPEDDGVDCVIMQLPTTIILNLAIPMNLTGDDLSSAMDPLIRVIETIKNVGKPFALWRSSMDEIEEVLIQKLEHISIPVFPSQDRAAKAMAALYRYNRYRSMN